MSVICHACHGFFEDYKELAVHIAGQKDRGHRRGHKWAAKLLLLSGKRDLPTRGTPLTEDEKQAKVDCRREVSGELKTVNAFCLKCKSKHRIALAVEYVQSEYAWKRGDLFMVNCTQCEVRR